MNIGEGISGAVFSDSNRQFRYSLWRIWDRLLDNLLFIGLNPSTASYVKDDAANALDEAVAKLHKYACECEIGPERTKAFAIYQAARLAPRAE